MKLATLVNYAHIVTSIVFMARTASAQKITNNNSSTLIKITAKSDSRKINYFNPFDTAFLAYYMMGLDNSAGQINTAISSNTLRSNSTKSSDLQPFNVSFLAYQGNLKEQGIPSGETLIFEYQTRNLTAKDVVKAAVRANKLPAQVLNDPSYLRAVESQLTSFSSSSDLYNQVQLC